MSDHIAWKSVTTVQWIRVFSLSEGLIDEIVGIVTKAAIAAIRSGKERITKAGVDELCHVPISQRRNAALHESLL